MIILETRDLKIYVKERLLMDAANLAIQHNERIGLVGTNGSGKTTLLEILAGQKQSSEGTVISNSTRELLPQLKNTNTTKSGGEVTQEYINQALAKKTDILLADEPTTNLDTEHIEKLENQLLRRQAALVIVSHDRAFLDSLCTTIWEIDDGILREYKGNYTDYAAQKELERRQQENAYENYVKKKQQLENALELKEQKASRATKVPKNVSSSEAKITGAKPYYANKQKKLRKSAKAIETRLEKLETVEKIKESPPIKMYLPNEETFQGRIVLRWDDVTGMIEDRTLWKATNFHIKGGDKIAILGKNGSGKTTLLKKIVNEDEGITISPAMKIGYFSQNLDVLDLNESILENVNSSSNQDETLIRTVLARLHFFREDVYKKVQVLSGGERVKVAFAKLFVSDINTLLLDEPTNFLDIEAVEALEELLLDYVGTILLVTHDRRFIQHIANRVLTIEHQEIHLFDGTYEEYKNHVPQAEADPLEDELLLLETKISDTLSRLSIEPSEELDQEFKELLARKKALENGRD
ncbi:Vga family ABC-F type ribosomal protection protein [Virgibacillus sp. NKC19-16]|uniref:Vga family ABC-F type ribosomal protection protein n=1 Tax=Virgibacillus salidurans TaxID=2831673 RepID=UPI001F161AC1|nr:Vga family ABC-F type ribosomal protection protein [Virgibacillus sp. NKC19-16]UJL46770.1 Vga family ABC-F type ribosomal protection protein [Virgibacillus sp. NKC19-16]